MKQVREGYKMTELGEIPQEWEVKKLGEITEKITDGSHFSPASVETSDYKICTVSNIKNSILDLESSCSISLNDYSKLCSNGCNPIVGDILLSKDGTVGKTLVFKQSDYNIVLLSSIAIIRPINKFLYSDFLMQYLLLDLTLQRLLNMKTGSAIKRIVLRDIKSLKVPVPSLEEQQKIASILSKVDEQIELTDNLIEKTKDLKKGLMQNLLTKGIGHTEFKETEIGKIPTGWEVKKLGETGQIVTGSTPKTSVKENYGVDYLWVSPADMGENKYIKKTIKMLSITGFNQTRKIPKGGIMITCIGSTIGKIGIAGEELSTNQQINSLICNSNIFNEYMYYAIDFNFSHYISYISNQAVPIINKTTFSMFNIPVPSLDEQKKIASILSSVDTQIEEYQNKKSKLEELKKGLMQQLLTGKIRVKVDSDIYALLNQEVCENI